MKKWLATLLVVGTLCGPVWAADSDVLINEIRRDEPGTDNNEYFELSCPACTNGQSLDNITYIVIGDATPEEGILEAVVDLTGESVPLGGYFLAAEGSFTLATADLVTNLNFENNDNVSHMLVTGFTGTVDTDLDLDDDGVLDITPWTSIVDCVSIVFEAPGGTPLYCADAQIGPDGTQMGHVFLAPDSNTDGAWSIGGFTLGTNDTPGANNGGSPTPVAQNGAVLAQMNATDVAVDLSAIGTGGTLTFIVLDPLPAGQLKDNNGNIGPTPHTVVGALTYDPPAAFTGTPKVHFKANDDGGDSNEADHYLCIQDNTDQVLISEINTVPSANEPAWEYIEVYNTTAGNITLWALAGDLVDATDTPEVSGNLNGVVIGPGTTIITASTTADLNENFRCEWLLRDTDLVRVSTDTWEDIRAINSLVALYGAGPTLLDAVWIQDSTVGWPTFTFPDDVGSSHAYDSGSLLTTARNDAGFRWKISGLVADGSHTTDHVRESETLADLGSLGWAKTRSTSDFVLGPGCLCCLSDGSCAQADQATCENLLCGQYFETDGLDCDTNPPSCASTQGACCTAFGDCIDGLTNCECGLLGGIFQGDSTTCGVVVCAPPTGVSINELEYDEVGTDDAEFVELLGPPGMSLDGWKLQLFNGFDGVAYNEIDLSGHSIPADRFFVIGTALVPNWDLVPVGPPTWSLQNGSPDGVVLCNGSTVVEAVSYEGSVAAVDVCTTGVNLNLPDIGVQDSNSEARGLQKLPNGGTWSETPNNTPGESNFYVTGACCSGIPLACTEERQPDCVALGGFYQGDATTCGVDTCSDICLTVAEIRSSGTGLGVQLCDATVNNLTDTIASTSVKSFMLQDATGGIAVFGGNATIDAIIGGLSVGSVIDISGTTSEFNGLFELEDGGTPLSLDASTNGTPPTPVTLSVADLQGGSAAAEANESVLVTLECVHFVDADGVATFDAGAFGTNYLVTDDNVTFVEVRVGTADQGLNGVVIPSGFVDITGVVGQFDTSAPPRDEGYQLLPFGTNGVVTAACPPPTGACCDAGLNCTEVSFFDCDTAGLVFHGNGTTCTPNPCQIIGACCFPFGNCVDNVGETDCINAGGNPNTGQTCANTNCTATETVWINEVRPDQAGSDLDEYFELGASAVGDLSGLTYLVIGDGATGSGTIEAVVDLTGSAIPGDGFFLAAEASFTLGAAPDLTTSLGFENDDNVTHLLVEGFTGALFDDLDTTDDGTLDVTPWDSELDCVALIGSTDGLGDKVYCATVVGPDAIEGHPHHLFTLPDGGAWQIGQSDVIGGSDTPGASNTGAPPNATGWQSCALHDPAGNEGAPTTWCLDLVEPLPRGGPPDPRTDTQIEPRFYGTGGTAQPFVEVVIVLDGGATGAVTVDAVCTDASTHGATVTVSTDGMTVTATFNPPLPNTECCTMTLGGGAAGSQVIKMLQGDVNVSGRVNATDKNLVKGKITTRTPPLAGDDYFYDINMSGRINATDKNLVKGRITSAPDLDAGCP
ncbi:MAG: hypothetical protein GY778_23285 [bacterium]|nr:hypothetical protein [bacterium]